MIRRVFGRIVSGALSLDRTMSPPPTSYSHRIWIFGPIIALGLLVAAYSAYWHVTGNTWAARLDGANGGEIMPGVTFAFANKSISGFPFRLDIVLDGVTIAHHTPEGETALRIEKLAIHALSYNASHYLFETDGLVSLARPGANGTQPNVLYITPAQSRASALLNQGVLTRFDLDMIGFAARDARSEETSARDVRAARLQFHVMAQGENSIALAIKANDLTIGSGYEFPFDRSVEIFGVRGAITQSPALIPLRKGDVTFEEGLDQWRAVKGEVQVTALDAVLGGKPVALTGALTLDETGDLSGDLKTGETVFRFAQSELNKQE